MRRLFIVLTFIVAMDCYSISMDEANKFVDKYDTAQKKILGFINCVTRVLTGDDAVTPTESRGPASQTERPSNLEGCFSLVGFKMGGGFSKLTAMFSKGGGAPSSLNTEVLEKATKAVQEDLVNVGKAPPTSAPIQRSLANEPSAPVKKPVARTQTNAPTGKIKTAW